MLCREFGCSRTALFRIFKDKGESGVLSVINATRMEAAKRLLAQGNSITQTATDVGYHNASSFLRIFKRYEQMTPGQYRDMLRKPE